MSTRIITLAEGAYPPAPLQPDWLPPDEYSPWEDLDDARAEVDRLRTVWDAALSARQDVRSRLEAAEAARQTAMEDNIRAGGDGAVTEHDAQIVALKAELDGAKERVEIAIKVWHEAIEAAMALIVEQANPWKQDLAGIEVEAQAEVADLTAQLLDAQDRIGRTQGLSQWIDRTVLASTSLPGEHISFEIYGARAPWRTDEERTAWVRARTEEAYREGSPQVQNVGTEDDKAQIDADRALVRADEVDELFDDEVAAVAAKYKTPEYRQKVAGLGPKHN